MSGDLLREYIHASGYFFHITVITEIGKSSQRLTSASLLAIFTLCHQLWGLLTRSPLISRA